jgi:hypothetical protein
LVINLCQLGIRDPGTGHRATGGVVASGAVSAVLRIIIGARSAAVMAIVAIAVAITVGGCGGSSSSNRSTASTTLAAYRSCLQKHGVRSLRAGGRFGTIASRINNPKYTAVLKDCGTPRRGRLSAKSITILHEYIACVAKHGYKLPEPNTSGNGPVFPAGTDRVRRYRTAAASCVSLTRGELRSIYGAA